MCSDFVIKAQARTDVGKGASRRLRHAGNVPGVVYGGHKEPASIVMVAHEIMYHLGNEAFYSSILSVNIDGRAESVVLRDLQRHPYKPTVLHVDLQRVSADEAIRLQVPLHFINEEICVGVKTEGGVLSHAINEVEISCLPRNLPEFLEVDVEHLSIGDMVHLSEITLPEGVELAHAQTAEDEEHDPLVVSVHYAQKTEDVDADEESEPDADDSPADPA